MRIRHLVLDRFRSYDTADVRFADDVTAVVGANGQGKTNLLEAIGWLSTASSFRGAPDEALIKVGADQAVIRAEGVRDGREVQIDAELNRQGRNRVFVNKQKVPRARAQAEALRVSVFAPDDLRLVKGGPAERRVLLDDAAVATRAKVAVARAEVDRVLRQRNTLLRQAGGRLGPDVESTLEVWDTKFAESGTALADARQALVDGLGPVVGEIYASLSGRADEVVLHYVSPWSARGGGPGLLTALTEARRDDLRRGVTTVGPHRDELAITLAGLPARTHASQGEQRSLAFALRLGCHRVVHEAIGESPVLLLDDVFSELDPERSAALVAHLPDAQTVLSTAGSLPPGIQARAVLTVRDGIVRAE